MRVVSKTSCTGHDKSNDKTGVARNRASLNDCDYLELVKFTDDTYRRYLPVLSNDTSSN